ncbi:MAG: polysaccharide deacetylase family protein [Sphingomonadales bacterium]|nr:polysaccharide deacetylase family protein [Sphingomonadales bacterium]
MTAIYITIDTEYSCALYGQQGEHSRQVNFDRSIRGLTPDGEAGIFHQMDILDRYGLKAVFFVDPMPALIWGTEAIAAMVQPIVSRGHDVQLHMHSEWLGFAGTANPLGVKTGRNMKDFSADDQYTLIGYGIEQIIAAGAPRPVAFRAGNYGANDDTLRALARHGIAYESSHCPGIEQSQCAISLGPDNIHPIEYLGVVQVPIGSIAARGGGQRHAQITALSAQEIACAVRHARDTARKSFTFVSHSFELLSRDRKRINPIIRHRFEKACAYIAHLPGVDTATYTGYPPMIESPQKSPSLLPHAYHRTLCRMGEQAIANTLYGAC